jgi:Flp pilus assembly protein TadG
MCRATGAPYRHRDARMPGRQRGIVMLFYMIALVGVIGMAGVALDVGLMMLTKTRLQNALDAAALDGARELFNTGGDTAEAETAAKATFAVNLAGAPEPTVAFSNTQSPFTAGGLDPKYVQVTVAALPVTTYLSRIIGLGDSYDLNGSAMAGPMPISESCGGPLGLCADPASGDSDCSDGNGCWGMSAAELTLHDAATGPGNYGLLQMGSGASPTTGTAAGMAGTESICVDVGDTATTGPGMQNNIRHATNTRFAQYQGVFTDADAYPGDVVTTSPLLYPAYELLLQSGALNNPDGVPRRRTMLLPVIDCTGVSGISTVPVLGHACVFLTRSVPTFGPTAGTVYAQIIDECLAEGGVPDPDSDSGAVRFMLFPSGSQA